VKVFVKVSQFSSFPNKNQLVSAMWNKNANFSIVAFNSNLSECDLFTLSWDKWLDDKRWRGLIGSKKI
jgi:hypothetical protein